MDSKHLGKNIFSKLVVITHCDHTISKNNKLQAYSPYVRELNLWCDLFDVVTIYSPKSTRTSNTNLEEFKKKNIIHKPIFFSNSSNKTDSFNTFFNFFLKFFRFVQLPFVFFQLLPAIYSANVIHLRSPSYPAFIASLIIKLLNKKSIVKYAGGFHSFPKENIVSKIQRIILLDYYKRSKILTYDNIDKENFITFFPALYSNSEIEKYRNIKICNNEIKQFLCVGRLNIDKGFDLVIQAFGLLNEKHPNLKWNLTFVGDGEYRNILKSLVKQNNVEENIIFTGALSYSDTLEKYSKSDVLIMPGIKEGWPKTIAEAWVTKTFVFAANRGNCGRILENNSGILFEPNKQSLYKVLLNYLNNYYDIEKYVNNGLEKTKYITLESYKSKLGTVISETYF